MGSARTLTRDDGVAPSEVELKFALGGTSTSRLLRHPALARLHPASNRREIQRDRYFDSPDFALAHLGLSLRIRESHGQWRQTVKDNGTPTVGLHARAEYECALIQPEPDHEQLARTPWAPVFARLRNHLMPAFEVRCTRTVVPLVFADGSRAQLCIDRGQIVGGGASLPVAELELELDGGHVARLYELARQLVSSLPLRIESQSKAERGMTLIGAIWRRDAPAANFDFRFKNDENAGEAIARLSRHALQETFEHAQNAIERNDPEDIHRVRSNLRRVRALLWYAAALGPTSALRNADDAAHALYRSLGVARNWDVLARDLLARGCSPALFPVLGSLRTQALRTLDGQLVQARCELQSKQFQDALLAIAHQVCELETSQAEHVHGALPEVKRKVARHDKVLRKRIAMLHLQTPAEQHVTRRLARRVRERTELMADTIAGSGRIKKRYLARLAKLQGALGHLHDWYTARGLLGALTPTLDIRAQAWLDHGQSLAMRAAMRASQRFLKIPGIWH